MKCIVVILAVFTSTACFAGVSAKNAPTGPAFVVHGRLSLYCGNPGFRIWVVGTKRILGVAESDPPEVAFMPAKLRAVLTPENLVFGDFTVVPLTKDEDGVMRMVRVIAAENLVIIDGQLNVIGRVSGKIEEEPNKTSEPAATISPSSATSLAPLSDF